MVANPRGRALIVDDSAVFRTALVEMLEMIQWRVQEASSGEEAIEQLRRDPPDVVILDQRMPRLSGAEVHERLRSHGLDTPVVLVSAATDVQRVAAGAGIGLWLQKPFDLDELEAALNEALRQARRPEGKANNPP